MATKFVTTIDGEEIYFIHVRSKHPNAMPLIMTHGWPGSIIELLNVIDPLSNPTAHGGRAEDAFDIVIPSMPGYGFSGKPTTTGWNPVRIARAWDILMKRLGYTRYVSQGGDWGAKVSEALARQAPEGLLGIHINLLLQQHDLSVPGREAIQVRVDIGPGVTFPKHTHPGEEIIYVLEGSLKYEVEGKSPVTLKAGDVLFIPAGTIHSASNVGSGKAAELATYVVEKGKPLLTLVK